MSYKSSVGIDRFEKVRVYKDGKWKWHDGEQWTPLTDHDPKNEVLRRMWRWAYLCVTGGGYNGIDRRRNRPAAYYAEVDRQSVDTDTDHLDGGEP